MKEHLIKIELSQLVMKRNSMKLSKLIQRLENIKKHNTDDVDVYFVDESGDFIGITDLTFNFPDMISNYRNDILLEDGNISDEKISSHIVDKYSFDLDGTLYPIIEYELMYSKPVIALGDTVCLTDKANKIYQINVKISESHKIIESNNKYFDNLYIEQQNNNVIKQSDDYQQYLVLKEKFKNIN